MRFRYTCTGIKHCEYLDNALLLLSHTHVTPETWEQMQNTRYSAYRGERDERKKKSTRYVFPTCSQHNPN
jgi:hypothetical protein